MLRAGYLASLGLVLSCYAVYVEHRHTMESEDDEIEPFKALCDIDKIGASCSAVFAMPQGKLLSYFGIVPHDHILDVPNAALGMIYYSIICINGFILAKNNMALPLPLIKIFSASAMASSVYLAIVLTGLKELCILCWTTHVINTLLTFYFFSEKATKSKMS